MAAQSAKLDKDESRRRILAAADELLGSSGLTDWTVENVASQAGCAKALVLYHFGSKQSLLEQVAVEVTVRRLSARVTALRLPPAKAIDRLWEELSREVTSGAFRLWLSLAAASFTTSLIEAARRGDAAAVRTRLAAGDAINATDTHGMTALLHAVRAGHEEIVGLLLARGAHSWTQNRKGLSALRLASVHGHTGIARRLIADGANVNTRTPQGDTALIFASLYGQTATAELLLAHGALVNLREANGITALMIAADGGDTELVRLLLQHGADVNAATAGGESALFLAREKGFRTIIQLLKRAGAVEPAGYRESRAIA